MGLPHALLDSIHQLASACFPWPPTPQEIDAEVFAHVSQHLGSSCLEAAFPMIFSAFARCLAPAETLLLWDRVIGFDSLLPLGVLAAAVMTFRCGVSCLPASESPWLLPLPSGRLLPACSSASTGASLPARTPSPFPSSPPPHRHHHPGALAGAT